jgi:cytidine deaminase
MYSSDSEFVASNSFHRAYARYSGLKVGAALRAVRDLLPYPRQGILEKR